MMRAAGLVMFLVCACSASTATSPPGSDAGGARDTSGKTTDGGALPAVRNDLECAESVAIGSPTCVVLRDHTQAGPGVQLIAPCE